jgi:hypothetical protein
MVGWAHISYGGNKKHKQNLHEGTSCKVTAGIPRRRWEDNIKINFMITGYKDVSLLRTIYQYNDGQWPIMSVFKLV